MLNPKTFRFTKWVVLLLLLALQSSAKSKHRGLIAPKDSTAETRKEDVQDCMAKARADVSFGKPALEEKELAPLQGHSTEAFVRNSLPVVDRNYLPVTSKSLLSGVVGWYGPANLSDRYVLCLLARGYQWDDGSPVRPGPAQPSK